MLLLDVLHVVLDLVDVLADLFHLLEELVHLAPVHVDGHVVAAGIVVVVLGLRQKEKSN